MQLSARNRIKGKVKKVEKGAVAAAVKIEVNEPAMITAMITKEAADDLGLKEGVEVSIIIKSTEIIVARD